MDDVARYVVSFLPVELQHLYSHPPSLNSPSSFLPLIRLFLPLTRYLVVLLAFYIVWTTIAGILGYFTRFARFAIRMGPIIGLLGWLMAASGQGSLPEVFELVKQWTGLSTAKTGPQSPGLASLAGLFNGNKKKPRTRSQTKAKAKKGTPEPDVLSSMMDSAAGYLNGEKDTEWIQSYVKEAIAKASGLDWLFNTAPPPEKKKRTSR